MTAWTKEIGLALLLLLAISVIGGLTGFFIPLLFLLIISLLIWQVVQINRFERWISKGGRGKYPKAKGIWEDIYYHVYLIKKSEKKRKKKLGKIIDQFRKSTDALPDAAVVLGKEDEIEWANTAAKNVLGLQPSDRGQRIPNLIRFPIFVRYLKSGLFNESITMPSPTNSNITLTVKVVSYGAGLRLLLAQDVTQLRKMEQMRKDFVANVSHELRTPLTVLKGYLETLQELDEPLSPLLSHSFQQMHEQTERMQYLVDDLLLLSNLETQPKKTHCVDIPALLSKICKETENLNNSAGRIELTLETNTHIYGDEQELRSAFSNLLGNALKYSPKESKVQVRWQQTPVNLVLDVIDKGEGIAESEIPRITERFYRIDVKRANKVSGTGLGLAIVKHVLLRHDARLVVTSELYKGSTFSCCFPSERAC
ncbi:MAG: phosphate regulon sensor histidine kinase PhoR [Methyloglobulus sp.]|nr:phosphate regulon sensor histidine kinase PhoR [Methyloglobulus sp.]